MKAQLAYILTNRLDIPIVTACCPFDPAVYTRFSFDVFQTIEPFGIDA